MQSRPDPWPEVVCLGEALIQVAPPPGARLRTCDSASLNAGGAEMNVAVAMSRLGFRTAFISRVGSDPFGDRILDTLGRCGVDRSGVTVDPDRPTGAYFKDYDGQRTAMYYYRRGAAITSLSWEHLRRFLERPSHVHVTGVLAALGPDSVGLLEKLFDKVEMAGGTVSFDVNYRPGLWSPAEAAQPLLDLAQRASIVFVGRDEAAQIWDLDEPAALRELLHAPQQLVIKDGPAAAMSVTGKSIVTVPALPARVAEPVGAGDAFAAGFLAAVLRSLEPKTALRWGHVLAAHAVGSVADQVDPPPRRLLDQVAQMSDSDWTEGAILQEGYFQRF